VRREHFGERWHVLWLLVWDLGLRVTGIRAIDVDHVITEEPDNWSDETEWEFTPHIKLRDRPEYGLPLKNTDDQYSDRLTYLSDDQVYVLEHYIENSEPPETKDRSARIHYDRADTETGSVGLVTTPDSARIGARTVQDHFHRITCPTTHEEDPCQCEGCQSAREEKGKALWENELEGACDRSRSPHEVRHGAITHMLNEGHDIEGVAYQVGTAPDTLRNRYDRADEYDILARIADTFDG